MGGFIGEVDAVGFDDFRVEGFTVVEDASAKVEAAFLLDQHDPNPEREGAGS